MSFKLQLLITSLKPKILRLIESDYPWRRSYTAQGSLSRVDDIPSPIWPDLMLRCRVHVHIPIDPLRAQCRHPDSLIATGEAPVEALRNEEPQTCSRRCPSQEDSLFRGMRARRVVEQSDANVDFAAVVQERGNGSEGQGDDVGGIDLAGRISSQLVGKGRAAS